jgi:hypothetical protein
MNLFLSNFWKQKSKWPRSGDKVFIGEALHRVGNAMHGEDWTGNEVSAYHRVYPFLSFAETLDNYRTALDEYESAQSAPIATSSAKIKPTKTDADNRALGEGDGRLLQTRREFVAELQDAARRHVQELEEWGSRHRGRYDVAASAWQAFTKENDAARGRLTRVIEWIVDAARHGDLTTYLRIADIDRRAGFYREAPGGFWDVGDIVEARFRNGHLEYVSEDSDPHLPADQVEDVFIFFGAESLSRSLATMVSPARVPEEAVGLHLSPYMRLALAVIRDRSISLENQGKIADVKDAVFRLAPHFGLDPAEAKTLMGYIATIVREPISQKGRHGKLGQTQKAADF